MSNFFANIRALHLVDAPQGMNKGGRMLVAFDLAAQAQNGNGTDTIQLGGGGSLHNVATTQTLAQMIASELRTAVTVSVDAVMPFDQSGFQAGSPIWPGGAMTVSGGNVTSIGLTTTNGGSAARVTTGSVWDAAAGVIVAFHTSGLQS